ncbi:hypothetical protein POTOM_061076 [Populus tomentosa]|uniref:non-specific serine/threonine protein kinase n=1 Tax=Populus tomentosa TaxID=118781 RepID=A0A8X7XPN0_POPTO|nr:hypothetical protein POTOM_061076 [Populus tomentosa]
MSLFSCCRMEKNNSFKGSRSSWNSKGYGKQGKTLSIVGNMSYKITSSKRKNINQVFTFRELAVATSNFSHHCLVGEGGFGGVYKGYIESIDQVSLVYFEEMHAYKGLQGNREFFSEILTLSMVKHLNLVKLLGYCADGDQKLLVYEFMANGSLESHLLDPLDWNTRVKIASGAAQGLEYLHGVADPQIIYRDFKASNILLDEDFNPKLSDFGLAKLGPTGGKDHVSTRVMGRRVIDKSRPTEEQNLIYWAMCLHEEADARPLMADVVTALEFLTKPTEEKEATMASTESIHYVDSVKGGNAMEELEAYSSYHLRNATALIGNVWMKQSRKAWPSGFTYRLERNPTEPIAVSNLHAEQILGRNPLLPLRFSFSSSSSRTRTRP